MRIFFFSLSRTLLSISLISRVLPSSVVARTGTHLYNPESEYQGSLRLDEDFLC